MMKLWWIAGGEAPTEEVCSVADLAALLERHKDEGNWHIILASGGRNGAEVPSKVLGLKGRQVELDEGNPLRGRAFRYPVVPMLERARARLEAGSAPVRGWLVEVDAEAEGREGTA